MASSGDLIVGKGDMAILGHSYPEVAKAPPISFRGILGLHKQARRVSSIAISPGLMLCRDRSVQAFRSNRWFDHN